MSNVLANDARFLRDPTGALVVKLDSLAVTLDTSDLEIGAVELKDSSTSNRAAIDASGRLSVDGSGVVQPVSGSLTVTDGGLTLSIDDGGGSITVDGSVAVTNFPASQAVTGTFWQVTQPVSGPLTDTQLRASAVPVSLATAPTTPVTGTFWQSTQPVSLATNTPDVTDRTGRLLGHVTVDSAPSTAVTGPLTDTQIRASALPVSTASLPLPSGAATSLRQDTQITLLSGGLPAALDADGGLKAHVTNTVPVTGSFYQATQPVSLGATVTVDGSAVTQPVLATTDDGFVDAEATRSRQLLELALVELKTLNERLLHAR